jgi:N6-L-threonylcarbamoyladenine synthase
MLVLGLESSCDETSAAVVKVADKKILSNVISSQHKTHRPYGGVVPELASREHLRNLIPVIDEALEKAGCRLEQLEGLAVTYGPGLNGALLVGLNAAKGLALSLNIPWIGVNHLEGHLLAAFLEYPEIDYPFLGLVVSGGHTNLYRVENDREPVCLATTRDDAAGEAFDKVAKLLDLGYPGGPAVDKSAKTSQLKNIEFPLPVMKDKSMDFSYSGLKSSVRRYVQELKKNNLKPDGAEIAWAFQKAAITPLIKAVLKVAQNSGIKTIVAGGGVAANSYLRLKLCEVAATANLKVYISSLSLCMDNAAMIAYAGGKRLMRGERSPWNLAAVPNLTYGVLKC